MRTKLFGLIFLLFLLWLPALGQTGSAPYPIIFVHGLDSYDSTWTQTMDTLAKYLASPYSSNSVGHFVLNAWGEEYGYDVTNYKGNNNVLGDLDDDVQYYTSDIANGSIFAVNFKNFWDWTLPAIYLYDAATPLGDNQSLSNQSSIYKQGYALKVMIQKVLSVTGAQKVILVGHSMGGLAIREYLQRQEGGQHKWWLYPTAADGHRVARVVTIGTPHLGSNYMNLKNGKIPSPYSEAIRDLRYDYDDLTGHAPNPSLDDGVYLFGGVETYVPTSFHNQDVNCNGYIGDAIDGINDGDYNGASNPNMPLPGNIDYTWITSSYNTNFDDGIVSLDRQYLWYEGDTLLTDKYHTLEPGDYYSIIRGLDEPYYGNGAYELKLGRTIRGFITSQPANKPLSWAGGDNNYDCDAYKVICSSPGVLKTIIGGTSIANSGLFWVYICNSSYVIIDSSAISTSTVTLNTTVNTGAIYIFVYGYAYSTTWKYPYVMKPSFVTGVEGESNINENISFAFSDPYPNPTKNYTMVKYQLSKPSDVSIKVYNSIGQLVKAVDLKQQGAGWHQYDCNLSNISAGVYFVRLKSAQDQATKKLIILR